MGRRTFLLIASIVVAAIGTGLVAIYVNNADTRARSGEQLVNVWVAKNLIPQSTAITRGMVQQEPFPQRLVSDSTVTDLRTIAGKVTSAQIFPQTPLDSHMFGEPSQAPANLVNIESKKRAMMLQMTEPARLAGLLQPGSLVDVYSTSEQGGNQTAGPLIRNVRVISPGGTVTAATGERVRTPSDTVTLELTEDQVTAVVRAISSGALYLVLLGGGVASGDQSP
jgi:pilus assembly protein CpaB